MSVASVHDVSTLDNESCVTMNTMRETSPQQEGRLTQSSTISNPITGL
jgi:hypothetical protein